MGEFIAVMNGVEFRTRHNDYGLRMPHHTSKAWHAVQNIPYPDVPPQVLAKKTVDEQVSKVLCPSEYMIYIIVIILLK